MGYSINITLKTSNSPQEVESIIKQIVTRATGMQPNIRISAPSQNR